jgi:hypothetical protein
MASGVNEVKIDISRFDDSGTYCRGAYEFDTAVEAIRSAFATELVRFTFAWAAFECVDRGLNLKREDGSVSWIAL